MGYGGWDRSSYTSDASSRRAAGVDDFAYSASAIHVHEMLDARRIKDKPGGKLESRDSADHPESNAVVVGMDVTGSNKNNAREAQRRLDRFMTMLPDYLPHPQVCFAANDDIEACAAEFAAQISEFEAGNKADEWIRSIKLVGQGGGNDKESYDLLLFALARLMVLDCVEKRKKKGYAFLYADEPIFSMSQYGGGGYGKPSRTVEECADIAMVSKDHIERCFGITLKADISLRELIEEVQESFELFILWPSNSSYHNAYQQYKVLFGADHVFELQSPELICESICGIIAQCEDRRSAEEFAHDLVAAGATAAEAASVSNALVRLREAPSSLTKTTNSGLPSVSGGAGRKTTRL